MNAVEQAIYERLTSSAALAALLATPASVYNTTVPQGSALPWVLFLLQAGQSETTDPHTREDLYYTVRAAGKLSMKPVGAIAGEIRSALEGAPLTLSGYRNFWLHRTEHVQYAEPDGAGGYIYHQGGIYRIRLAQD